MKPAKWIFIGYLCIILVGWLLLSLPISSSGERLKIIDSLFTATSSVCVTGLIVRDTPKDFTLFGHIVILILIQLGGLGYMTIGSFLFLLLGRRLSIRQSAVASNEVSLMDRGRLGSLIKRVLVFTFAFELIGMLIFAHRFSLRGFENPLWLGLFHSVSAFCNAGFSLFSDSFIGFQNDPWVLLTGSSLFIIGGLGFITLSEIFGQRRKRLSLHTRLVLVTTLILIISASVIFFVVESDNLLKDSSIGERVLLSYFQAGAPRTAGFTALDMGRATSFTLFWTAILMFIGASPGGTGGGAKTTTFAVSLLAGLRYLQGRKDVSLYGKRVREEDIRRAFYVIILSVSLVCVGILILSYENLPFERVLFEQLSAFGTVGLSTGSLTRSSVSLSYDFSTLGKLVIIITMFVGRIGPLTLGMTFLDRRDLSAYRYPEEMVQIG